MEKNNTSSSSICRKIRQALASAFRAIHRINQYHTHSNSPSSPPTTHLAKNTATRANPPLPQHIKVNTEEGGGAIPIMFDYSTPTTNEYNADVQGKKPLDINDTFAEYIQRAKYRIRTVSNVGRGKRNSAPEEANGTITNKMEKEDQKDHFADFIQHAKKKFRTTSNIGTTSSLKKRVRC